MGLGSRLKHGFNAFLNRGELDRVSPFSGEVDTEVGPGYSSAPFRQRFGFGGEGTIKSSIYMRMAMDCASIDIRHVKKDEQGRYIRDVLSGLSNCLNIDANIDQSGFAFLLDFYLSLFESGHIAILPVETTTKPSEGGLFDILNWRVATIVGWHKEHVRLEAYNELTGRREQLLKHKREVAIFTNPLFSVMNEPNSTLQRLSRKLMLLDGTDEKAFSGKLDMLIQLPYPIRDEGRRQDARKRRKELEDQINGSALGVGFIDAQEKVVQLNRPVENNLLKQVEYLLELLYTQLGLTPAVMNGTASEAEMLNYFNRTIVPILETMVSELRRKFLTKTGRTQGHDIMYFRDPFKLVPMKDLAELADKFTRNEIVTSNEFRGFIGMRPVTDDPKADMLINSNLTVDQSRVQDQEVQARLGAAPVEDEEELDDENDFAEVDKVLDETFAMIGVDA